MRVLMLLLGLLLISHGRILLAQSPAPWVERLGATVEERTIYQLITGPGRQALFMDYASPTIQNPEDWSNIPAEAIFFEVELVFTRYPLNLDGWEMGFDTLLQQRFQQLANVAPELMSAENVRWRIILQTGCTSQQQARECFHGFVVRYGTVAKTQYHENLAWVRKYWSGQVDLLDSTTLRVLDRHPEWRGMAIAADWTSSMYGNGVMMAQWVAARLDSGRVEGLLFFNDGDSLPDSLKTPGAVGGIHPVPALTWPDIVRTLEEATLGGDGGDQRENDLEGVLAAQTAWPEAAELVLICDNKSPVRDLELLPQIRMPIRVVACGSSNGFVHPHYLTIAAYTHGTLHIMNEDIAGLDQLKNGEMVQVGEFVYKKVGEMFERLGRLDDPDKF